MNLILFQKCHKNCHQSGLTVTFQPIFASRLTNTQPSAASFRLSTASPSPWHPSIHNQIQLHF